MRVLTILTLTILVAATASARKPRAIRGSSASQRKRLNINPLLTPSGTVEVEWGGLYSFESSNLLLPSVVKYTLDTIPVELSSGFDSFESIVGDDGRHSYFGQSMVVTALTAIKDGKHFDVAVAPQATFFLRGESGVRLGGIVLGRLDAAGNSMGFSAAWSGATRHSDLNPAGTLDLSVGYSRALPDKLKKFSPHINYTFEKSTGIPIVGTLLEGIEYQATPRFAIDFSAQHIRAAQFETEHQVLVGVTWNLGKMHSELR